MAFTHGKNAAFSISNSAGALTSIKTFLDEVTFPQDVDAAETTTFGQGAKTFIAGLLESKVTLKGKFDGAAAAQDALISATLAAQQAGTLVPQIAFSPAGTATGTPVKTVSVIITSYEISAPVGDVVTFSLEAQGSGPVTSGTNP